MRVPIYKSLATRIQDEIHTGVYPVGTLLPPELELCETHKVSRHTMREAIRILNELGIVQRKRGLGTTVIASNPEPVFVHALGGIAEIRQLADVAPLCVRRIETRPLTSAERERIGIDDGNDWLICEATRLTNGHPIAFFEIYVNGKYAAIADKLQNCHGAVKDLIAQEFGVVEDRIEQTITAGIMTKTVAEILHGTAGISTLHTLRRYIDSHDEVILVSDSIHSGTRFAYSMTYRRSGDRPPSDNQLDPSPK